MSLPDRPVLFSFVLWVLLSLAPLKAAEDAVSGRIVDPDGRAVRAAAVMLVDGATVVASALTDAEGRFTLAAPHGGPFELLASADGLRGRADAVHAADIGELRLAVSAVRESVVVSAAQADVPLSTTASSVTIVTAADLEAQQIASVPDALRLVPGLSVLATGSHGAQTSVFPRGGESDYTLVLVDGVPANTMGGGFDFAHLGTANVERVEIVRGPQSALHGSNAIGAVVSVVTRRGGPPTASAEVEAGSLGTSRVAAGTSGGSRAWGWTGTFERTASDGLVQNDDYRRATAAAGLGWSGARGASVRANVHYTDDERGYPGPFGSDPGGTFSGIDTVSRGSNERWLGALAGTISAGGGVRIHGQLAHARIDGQQISAFDPSNPSEITSRRSGGRLHADMTAHASTQVSAGGEVYRERGASTFITNASGPVPIDRTLAGLFGEVRWNHHGRVFLTAGVRADRIARAALAGNPAAFTPRPDFAGDVVTSVNPKAGVAWFVRSSAGSFTKLRASAGTGIRPPDAFEIAFTDNPSLEPERSRSFEAGIDHSLAAGRIALEATGFHNRYDDLIVAVGSFRTSSRYRTDNISNARAQGLELAGTARGRLSWGSGVDMLFRASLTFLDTEILAVDGGPGAPPPFTPGESLLRRPARQFAAEWTVRSGRFNAFATAGGRSRTRDVDPSFGTFGGIFDAPGYATVNTGAAWRIGRGVEVFGRVTNLLDRDYEEALGFPAAGRGGMAGLRVAAGR